MVRWFPVFLPWYGDDLVRPHPAAGFPGQRPGFLQGDPFRVIPATCALLDQQAEQLLPWTGANDLLLAPYPEPGAETADLIGILDGLPPPLPVLLYPRTLPLWPNLVVAGQETLQMLPARRLGQLLRGSPWAGLRPGPSRSLQNRSFLIHALGHQRSLAALAQLGNFDDFERPGTLLLAPETPSSVRAAAPPPRSVTLPWWNDGSHGSWMFNRQLAKAWPASWKEVEVQVAVGKRWWQGRAAEYWTAFRRSGCARRVYWGASKVRP